MTGDQIWDGQAAEAHKALDVILERWSQTEGQLFESKREIERLRADNERLCALLTEARKWMVAPCGAAETSDLLFRIDAALGGGEEA